MTSQADHETSTSIPKNIDRFIDCIADSLAERWIREQRTTQGQPQATQGRKTARLRRSPVNLRAEGSA